MKPEEAIERLHQFLQQSIGIIEDADRGDDYAVKVKEDAEKDLSAIQLANEAVKEVQQYREIGSVEECQEAREKQIPKAPIMKPYYEDMPDEEYLCCPTCGDILTDRIPDDNKNFYFHCLNCGQKFDWSENLEGMEDE